MSKIKDCSTCIHKGVCKHEDKWLEYVKQHLTCRKNNALFDCEPTCSVYLEDTRIKDTESEHDTKESKDLLRELLQVLVGDEITITNLEDEKPKNTHCETGLVKIGRGEYERVMWVCRRCGEIHNLINGSHYIKPNQCLSCGSMDFV